MINKELSEIDEIAKDLVCSMLANPKFNEKPTKWIMDLAYEMAKELVERAKNNPD